MEVFLSTQFRRTLLKVELPEWYNINVSKESWRKFDNSDTSNMYCSMSIHKQSFAIKLANVMLENGIFCRIIQEETTNLQLASYWGQGNILVVPVLDNNKHYLYFIVNQ